MGVCLLKMNLFLPLMDLFLPQMISLPRNPKIPCQLDLLPTLFLPQKYLFVPQMDLCLLQMNLFLPLMNLFLPQMISLLRLNAQMAMDRLYLLILLHTTTRDYMIVVFVHNKGSMVMMMCDGAEHAILMLALPVLQS